MGKKQEPQKSEKERTVFISGLPYSSSEEEIKTLFSGCGQIELIKLPKYQDSGRLIGYGHIIFQSHESVQQALNKNNSQLGDRYITVQQAKGQKSQNQNQDQPPEDCRSIFIKNLPYSITSEKIGDAFRHCGQIDNVRMVYNTVTKNFKGFCYIDFRAAEAIKPALKMNGKDIEGRNIFVDFEVGKPRLGFKYADEQIQSSKYNAEQKMILKQLKKINSIMEIKKKKIKKEKVQQKVAKIKNFVQVQKEELQKQKREQIL